MSYPFKAPSQRAQCLAVIDGDTIDVLIDKGEKDYSKRRIRFSRINAWEMKSKDAVEAAKALEAKNILIAWLKPNAVADLSAKEWPLRLIQEKNADEYGRRLAEVFFFDNGQEKNANDELIKNGMATLYKK